MTDFFKPGYLKARFGEEIGPIYCQDCRTCLHYVLFVGYLELVVPLEVSLLLPAFTVGICSKSRAEGVGAQEERLEHKLLPLLSPF